MACIRFSPMWRTWRERKFLNFCYPLALPSLPRRAPGGSPGRAKLAGLPGTPSWSWYWSWSGTLGPGPGLGTLRVPSWVRTLAAFTSRFGYWAGAPGPGLGLLGLGLVLGRARRRRRRRPPPAGAGIFSKSPDLNVA